VSSSREDFVQVGEADVTCQERGTSQTDFFKQVEQKLLYLEEDQKHFTGKFTIHI
jgi:hypothetical protein